MRIAIAGFGTESSMFSRHVMHTDDFHFHRGAELAALYDLDGWLGADGEGIEWIPLMRAQGGAGGEVEPAAFDAIVDELVTGLTAAGPIDGLYFDLHGAAHVQGRELAEEHLLRVIRSVVGDATVISMSMDPHGNFSRELAGLVDLAASHRHAPHIDNMATRERAVVNLVKVLRAGRLPVKVHVRVPVLLPGERTSTVVEPGATVFGAALPAIAKYDVLDANIWVGFAWADESRNAAAVLVTGYDLAEAEACAGELARGYWDAREDFVIVSEHSGSWSEALDFVISDVPLPVFVSDSGDNVTAGSSGDVTYALRETLDRPDVLASGRAILFAGLVDVETLAAAVEEGVGGIVDRAIGATVDARYGAPVPGPWTVVELVDGRFGEGYVAAILTDGRVSVSVHSHRSKFTSPDDPTAWSKPGHAWFDLGAYDVVVVKNGYLFPGQVDLSRSAFMALTPGGTDLDFDRLEFSRVDRPIFPLDRDFAPDLTPVVVPAASTL
jgi:microcystin degradation protein MlrC